MLLKFLFGDRSTSGLDTWLGLTQRVTHKIFGEIPQGNTHYKPMGKSDLETDMLTLRCQRQLWKFGYNGKKFGFSEVGLKTHFRQFPALWLDRQWYPIPPPPYREMVKFHSVGRPCQNPFHQISRHLAIQTMQPPLLCIGSYGSSWIFITLRKAIKGAQFQA